MNEKTTLKQQVKTWIAEKRTLRNRLRDLKEKGAETGEERHQLRMDYNWHGRPRARAAHLAHGLVRGRKYLQIEQKCAESPMHHLILEALQNAGVEGYTMDDVYDWVDGKEKASESEAAA